MSSQPAQHSVLGASSAERWMNCPGSIRESKGMPNESSVYAREGSCAHRVAELCLNNGTDADDWLGEDVEGFDDIEVDEEMVEGVQTYLDTIAAAIKEYTDEGHTDHELQVEVRCDLSAVHPEMFGTCDAVLFLPAWKRIIVLDFKYGYIGVPVERNKQTMYYAVGALITRYHNRGVESVELVIVQPRDGHSAAVKRWECAPVELLDFIGELKEAAARTEEPDAPLKAGKWCKFCPAAPKCPALRGLVEEAAMVEMLGEFMVPKKAEHMTVEQLQNAWDNAKIIESWVNNVKSYAHTQAIGGNVLPRCKLVEGRSRRRWRDEAEARSVLKGLVAIGLINGDIETTKLKSPNQVETLLGKKQHKRIDQLFVKGKGSLSLVPIDDERPPARLDVIDEFPTDLAL